eukprot:8608180-Pyramimonas_sp.AAC.1
MIQTLGTRVGCANPPGALQSFSDMNFFDQGSGGPRACNIQFMDGACCPYEYYIDRRAALHAAGPERAHP